jgi:hypothetical protein
MATTLDIATPIFPVAGVVAVVEDHLSNSLHLVLTLPNTQLVKYVTNKAAQQPHASSVLSKAIRLTPLRYMPTWLLLLLLLTLHGIRTPMQMSIFQMIFPTSTCTLRTTLAWTKSE